MATLKQSSALPLSLLLLTLLVGSAQAFKPRTLSQLPTNLTNLPGRINTTLGGVPNNVTTLLPNFPANLTGNLTGIKLPNATELLLIEQYVLNVTRPVVASFIDATNTTIDCVPVASQLALLNSLLKNHTLQLVPPPTPLLNMTLNSSLKANYTSAVPVINGTLQSVLTPKANATIAAVSGALNKTCPQGSVPVPRLTVADIAKFGSLQAFLNSALNKGPPPNISAPSAANTGHEYATTSPNGGPGEYYGIQTSLSVWQPFVETPPNSDEFSLSQVWVTGGSGLNLQTIEAGWQVDNVAYGDNIPHLFIFSTRMGYTDGVCYAGRKDCPQGSATFVQVSNSVYPTITLQASGNGNPVQYTLLVTRDPSNGNWWVKLGDEWVGYYPGNLYTTIANSADSVQLGGEIVDTAHLSGSPPGMPHTKTQMGSGQFSGGRSAATVAYHYNMMYVDGNNSLQTLDGIQVVNTNPSGYDPACYSGELVTSTDGPQIFFFGGPGFSAQCPL